MGRVMPSWPPLIDGMVRDSWIATTPEELRAWRDKAAPMIGYLDRDGREHEAARLRDAIRRVTARLRQAEEE